MIVRIVCYGDGCGERVGAVRRTDDGDYDVTVRELQQVDFDWSRTRAVRRRVERPYTRRLGWHCPRCKRRVTLGPDLREQVEWAEANGRVATLKATRP